jgi:hypothetical protein
LERAKKQIVGGLHFLRIFLEQACATFLFFEKKGEFVGLVVNLKTVNDV